MTPDSLLTWVAVSRGALTHNLTAIQGLLSQGKPPPRVIAVVKANAYGHGAVEAAAVFAAAGVDFFAVTTPDEALTLRNAGIHGDILVFLPPLSGQVEALLEADISLTLSDADNLTVIAAAAARVGRTARVHLKVDTGMGRLGALPDAVPTLARAIADTPNVRLEGVYTHFGRTLEKEFAPTERQFATFRSVLAALAEAHIDPGLRHCANSAAILRAPEMWLDAVRPGTLLYGQYPSPSLPKLLDLRETWKLHTRVVSVREVPAGTAVGYGGEFVTRRASRLAVLPIGFADGFTLAPASATAGWRGAKALLRGVVSRGPALWVTLNGKRAPVVGRVAMQTCTIDITDIGGVSVGDIAAVPARRIMTNPCLPRIYEE